MARLDAAVRHRRLDIALAAAADPWSDGALLAAAGVVLLVAQATHRSPPLSLRTVRPDAVLAERESLLALAERLAVLLADPGSPAYVGGSEPAGLAALAAQCAHVLEEWPA